MQPKTITNVSKHAANLQQNFETTKQIYKKMKQQRLNFPDAQINRDFLIKISGTTDNGFAVNTAVGITGLIAFVGVEFANKFLERAYRLTNSNVCRCCLRSGKKVYFYNH